MKRVYITKDKRIVILDCPMLLFVENGKIYTRDGIPSEEAVEAWITINGAKVPLKNGEIAGGANGKLNGQKVKKNVAKTYNFRYNYTVSKTKRMREKGHEIPKGSKVTGVKTIAKGSNVKQASNLTKRYKVSDPTKWQKVRCNVNVHFPDGTLTNREVHYYYHPEVGEVDYKFPTNKKQIGGKKK